MVANTIPSAGGFPHAQDVAYQATRHATLGGEAMQDAAPDPDITAGIPTWAIPWLTPLRGKIPVLDAWPTRAPATVGDVEEWLLAGYNLGLRTGEQSGIFVVDVDKGATWTPPGEPTVRTPGGGQHFYYRAPTPCPGNSASKLAPHVDTRGTGGQVVFPGSTHPSGGVYVWNAAPPEVLPEVPEEIRAKLQSDTVRVPPPPIDLPGGSAAYAQKALQREVYQLSGATEGTRNDTLNRAAFNLGQLVAGGALDDGIVRSALFAAARQAGLSDSEIEHTLRSGLTGGAKHPRTVPERTTAKVPPPVAPRPKGAILIPGTHVTPDGEYVEVGSHRFIQNALEALPAEALYRRAGVAGEINGAAFTAVGTERMRSVLDKHLRLALSKDVDGTPQVIFKTCSRDLAALVCGSAAVSDSPLRELRFLASHPVYVGNEFDLAHPGWNADSGTYLASAVPEALDIDAAKAVLDDLVCDFPFATQADKANYFGLMLTPILRPALNEPVPMHLIGSPVERCGKTKLAEVVLGCSVLGAPTPAMQLGVHEEEREKRITSLLLSGASVVHLDNLREFVDSPALASLLTSTAYQGRVLGSSRMVTIPNGLTVVATGNNIHATGEVAKRVVPILLMPASDAPEARQDYRHPLLRSYVESVRPRVLGALLGLVEHWRKQSRPLGSVGFGGFERWSAVVGGIMKAAGYREWLANMPQWRGVADDFSAEAVDLIEAWIVRWGQEWVEASKVYDLAAELGIFDTDFGRTDLGRRASFAKRVLARLDGRVLCAHRMRSYGRGAKRRVRLEVVQV